MNSEFLSVNELKEILFNTQAGYKDRHDKLVKETNENLLPKYEKLGIVPDMSKYLHDAVDTGEVEIFCDIPGCRETFHGPGAYKTHYNRVHRHLCRECKRSFPTAHLLDLHLCEVHDSYFNTLVEHGKATYKCFVEECTEVFKTTRKRKDHCIEEHKLPPDFRFGLLDHTTKKKVHPKPKKEAADKMAVDGENQETDERTHNTKSFSFGHTKEKMFNSGTSKALDSMKELREALPDVENKMQD